jgi:hypothetical protein
MTAFTALLAVLAGCFQMLHLVTPKGFRVGQEGKKTRFFKIEISRAISLINSGVFCSFITRFSILTVTSVLRDLKTG